MNVPRRLGRTGSTRVFLIVLSCLLAAPPPTSASPTAAPAAVTVGEFAALVAMRVLPLGEAETPMTPDLAVDFLRKGGIRLRSSHSSFLTQADAADLFQQFEIKLQTPNPGTTLDRERALALLGIFGDTLAANYTAHNPVFFSRMKGTGPVSGSSVAGPSLDVTLEDCRSLPTVRECNDCCKNVLDLRGGNLCGKLCNNSRANRASPFEPTP